MMNHASSRSHTIFRLYIQSMSVNMDSGTTEIAESILNFVDLAGSEKVSIHDVHKKPYTTPSKGEFGNRLPFPGIDRFRNK